MTSLHNPTRLLRWFAILALPLLFIAACGRQGGIRPLAPTIVPNQVVAAQPQLVTFTELEEDPTVYQDKVIRVTGMYISLPVVACDPHSGPQTSWALVAEDLRLDMVGFETLLNQFSPQDLTLTLDGVLRRYDGPLGCGKRPAPGILWYLEVFQIIQPNPLVQTGIGPSGGTAVIPPPFPTGTDAPPTPDGEETPEEVETIEAGTPTRTPTPGAIPTASSTPTISPDGSITPAGTATVTRTPTRTSTPGSTPTSGPGGGTPTPSRTPTAGATSPPLPTATPDGYPGPVPSNTPYP
jgi:hypothetical protein